jgi:superfamily II DNA/RNA helicase
MVFCRTKRTADQVAATLATRGFAAAAVHGDLGQGQRERALRAFRNGKIDVLVATEVAARGLDVDDVTHVVNYECPEDEKAYLHRIGRTARAGRSGVAVTFVDWRDMHRWKLINEALSLGLAEPPETYSTSEHFRSELDIPEGVTGNLPRAQQGGRQGLEAEELEDLGETGRNRSPATRRPGARDGSGRDSSGRDSSGRNTVREGAVRDAAPRKPRVRKRTRGGLSARGEQAEPAQEHPAQERSQPATGRRRRSRGGRKGPVTGQV